MTYNIQTWGPTSSSNRQVHSGWKTRDVIHYAQWEIGQKDDHLAIL